MRHDGYRSLASSEETGSRRDHGNQLVLVSYSDLAIKTRRRAIFGT